ncbi:hypothetical protein [Streptomyces sp. NPDC001985]|uniref:hypothetical protein n=1 Tax=Streptomyces sp. NPDC001985 TaxID=3154406 RepID=UPI003325E4F7
MIRRPIAVVAALVLLVEAVGLVVIHGVLATFVDGQSMSLDGLDPAATAAGTWVAGGAAGVFLAGCALVSLLAGVRDRAPGRAGRVLLIAAAVVHAVLGAVTVGLVGWSAFAVLMVGMGGVVAVLVAYGKQFRAGADRAPAAVPEPAPPRPAAP